MARPETSVLASLQIRRRGRFTDFTIRFARNRAAVLGLAIIVAIGLAATFAPVVAPYDPLETDFSAARQAPDWSHFMGTDEIGRDVLSRVIWGARMSLPVGIIPVAIAAVVGTILGLVAGYFGGLIDSVIMRLIDVMMAFPGILLAVAIIAVLGPGLTNLMIAVGTFSVPLYTRLIRGSTLTVRESVYVEAAHTLGARDARIILQHILPNIMAPLIVLMTLGTATAILAAAALNFLGLGTQPPDAEWGSMLNAARPFLRIAWWMSIFPGLAITITVLAMNMIGDSLRDALDPRLRT